MSAITRTFQWLLTASLALGTSVAGLAPRCADSACPAVRQVSAESCCCGDRCGMPCCAAQEAPTPERVPAPMQGDGADASSPLGLVWSQLSFPTEVVVRRGWSDGGDAAARSLCDGTLQANHVRIDA